MASKNFILNLIAEQAYIHNIKEDGNSFAENEILFNAISETYIPLLNMLERLEADNVPCKLGLVLSAPLCTLLEDPQVQKQYLDWLDSRIALGEKEKERNASNPELLAQTERCLEKATKDKLDYSEKYGQDILGAIRSYAKKGVLELTATAASYAFLPHYADLTEVLNAQIETGLYAQKHFFGEAGEGFYLPYLGWAKGIDKALRSYGVNYSIVDTRSFLFAQDAPETGIFRPLRTDSSLVLFARDSETPADINSEDGFRHNEVYLSQQRDIGFELDRALLGDFLKEDDARINTGYKYWANGEDDEDETDESVIYNEEAALKQAKEDAIAFYEKKSAKLLTAQAYLKDESPCLVCAIPAELLGQKWAEGMIWLENVIRLVAEKQEIQLSLCREQISSQFTLPKITPYPCAASGTGYGEDLLDSSNSWMLRYIRKASERMIDLTERFPAETGLKARLLNLGAKEVLLAQSSAWPKMMADRRFPDYASDSFKKNIISFTTVFDSLASSTVSTEWLTKLEKEHAVFPWINYRIFSRKK